MGNQQYKEKPVNNINNSLAENIKWGKNNQSKKNENNMSSFMSSEIKINYTIAQNDFSSHQPHYTISVKKGEQLRFKSYSPDKLWVMVEKLDSADSGWIPAGVIGEIIEESQENEQSLQQYKWYHGTIPRSFAEYLLNSGITGSFLVRESESNRGLRSISLRYEGKIYHFRISKDYNNKYHVTENQGFDSIKQLIDYHCKYPDGLPCQLLYPAPKGAQATVFGVGENYSADVWEIDRTEIIMKNQLGCGQYGIVYEAFWKSFNITVAVKTVKTDVSVAEEFLKEAKLMKSLEHPNLVRLLGVCTQEPPNYIITEFMENGNLLDYLRSNTKDLSPPVLLYMAIQISAGMAYLEKENFIHRDLAARNCLVGQDNIVKVADFGLARCMELDDTYTAHVGAKFPIKWTAPEGLAYNIFSTKSDVWAFGILLWELATYGMSPYPGIELSDVYVYLEKGNRMCRPKGCPNNIYDLMTKCWQWFADNRPSFKELHVDLENLLSNINEQIDIEIAKETISRKTDDNRGRKSDQAKRCSNAYDCLPTPPDQDELVAHKAFKRKEPPVPPLRTTPLKDLSLTASFTMSNSMGIMEDSIIEDAYKTVSDDELLPLPPSDNVLSQNFHKISLHEQPKSSFNQSMKSSQHFLPSMTKTKSSKRPDQIPAKLSTSERNLDQNKSFFPNRSYEFKSSQSKAKEKELGGKMSVSPVASSVGGTRSSDASSGSCSSVFKPFRYLTLPKQSSPKTVSTDNQSEIKRIHSVGSKSKTDVKDFQTELRSKLKMKMDNNGMIEDHIDLTVVTSKKKEVEQNNKPHKNELLSKKIDENTKTSYIPKLPKYDVLVPAPGKSIISRTEDRPSVVQQYNSKKADMGKSLNDSGNNGGGTEGEDEISSVSKEKILSDLTVICQELERAQLKPLSFSQNSEFLNSLIEKLETTHSRFIRFGNSSISSAKLKFKLIEQCTQFLDAIDCLRKSLRPYNHSSVLISHNNIKLIVIDLQSLMESCS